jgi:hypothetical protein
MSRQSEVIRLWRRRIRKADIARLTLFSVGEVNQIIDCEKRIDAIKRKTQPPETCETAKNKYDWLPADDEANIEGINYLPTPAEIANARAEMFAGQFAFGRRKRPVG